MYTETGILVLRLFVDIIFQNFSTQIIENNEKFVMLIKYDVLHWF